MKSLGTYRQTQPTNITPGVPSQPSQPSCQKPQPVQLSSSRQLQPFDNSLSSSLLPCRQHTLLQPHVVVLLCCLGVLVLLLLV